MNLDTSEHIWGAPQTDPAQWSRKKTLAAVGVAVLLAAGGAAVIHAADAPSDRGGPTWGPGPGFGPGGPDSADLPVALHGQFVVSDGHGGFTTELTQTGTVTDVSDTSITARSADGFTQTYAITAQTRQGRPPARSGDTATIRAVSVAGTSTATAISPQR